MATRLTAFIKANRNHIIDVWAQGVRALPIARDLARPILVDHIPDLLERICDIADHVGAGREPGQPWDLAELHARERLDEGFDLAQVVGEYRMLRSCILRLWVAEESAPEQLTDLQALDEAIDISIGASIDRYTKARDRTLLALDRIATEAFGSRNLDELLQRLLHVMKDTTSAVDTTAILLREGDLLRVRAAVGLGREAERNLTMKVGEGFAGSVAAAAHTFDEPPPPYTVSPILRTAGLQTLYGVPLIEDGEVIGVAHMGSKTAPEFSIQDKRLFAAMVARATSAIRQHMLHEAAVQASKEALEREAEMRSLADNIPQLAWMADSAGARFWFNERWYEYSGASLDQLQGWGWQQFHHPAHVESVVEKYRHAFASGEPWEDTYPLRARDGHYHWFLSRAVPIRNPGGDITRWFGTSTDITDSRLKSEVSSELTTTLESDAIVEQITKLTVPDFADRCVVELGKRDATPASSSSSITVPLVARGNTIGAINFEMTGARRFQRGQSEVATELARCTAICIDNAHLFAEAKEASKAREAILAIVSHELRSPLAAIDLAATGVLHATIEPRLRKPAETIRRACERMDKIIGDLLDMATIQSGRLRVESEDVAALEVLNEIVELHEPLATEKGIKIIRDFEVDGVHLFCDRNRIEQVFANLIGNAKKFCRSGDVIFVHAKVTDKHATFTVEDTGPGISEDELPHVFDAYWSGTVGKGKGTGLGLYIANAIVKTHGGKLSVTSKLGAGTSFTFTLPIAGYR